MNQKKIVLVDRDGTIIREPKDGQIDSLEKLAFIPGIISGLKLLIDSGFSLAMATNQDGLGTKKYPRRAFETVQKKVIGLLEGEGIVLDEIFICPHREEDGCLCRKPRTGLVKRFIARSAFDPSNSFVIGDRETDVLFAQNLGFRSVRLTADPISAAEYRTADALDACRYIARSARAATVRRVTNETNISATIRLDGDGSCNARTGIGFFDHMLAQLARHSGIDIALSSSGDLHVDEHHTVEDTGFALGEAIRAALGAKRGIRRFAFAAPLDESLAEVALDLSGRQFLAFDCPFRRERVGELPTELVEDFFRAFAGGLKATIHIRCRGRNEHHKIEATFKAVAQALRSAITIDQRMRTILPTTKGKL